MAHKTRTISRLCPCPLQVCDVIPTSSVLAATRCTFHKTIIVNLTVRMELHNQNSLQVVPIPHQKPFGFPESHFDIRGTCSRCEMNPSVDLGTANIAPDSFLSESDDYDNTI